MKKINLLILGPGKIAHRFFKGQAENINYYGVAGRNINKAKEFANTYNIEHVYTIDQALIDPDIDAIYIALPNPLHHQYTKLFLEHKKHVLCEKPFVSTIEECNELYDLAAKNNLLLMEADKQLFLPLTYKIKEIIKSGLIGQVKYMRGSYCDNREGQDIFNKNHWVFDKKTGGSLRDIGIYPLAYFCFLNDFKITKVNSTYKKLNDVDSMNQTDILFDNGVLASITSGFEVDIEKCCDIYGTLGKIHIDNFWKTGKATIILKDKTINIEEEFKNDFYYESKHFADCIINKQYTSPIIARNESLKLIEVFNTII